MAMDSPGARLGGLWRWGGHELDEVVGVLGMGGTRPWGYGTYGVFTENRLQPGRWATGCTGRYRTHAHKKAGLARLSA